MMEYSNTPWDSLMAASVISDLALWTSFSVLILIKDGVMHAKSKEDAGEITG
jgi:hypothetical protein